MRLSAPPASRRSRQGGGFMTGLIIGLLIGLAIALGVALYVAKVPVPFLDKVPQRTAEQDLAEQEKNKNWQPNAPLAGKNPARPVVFREEPFTTHQKLYYSLEAMDLVETMQRKVFHAIQVDQAKLDKLPDILTFMAKNGVDTAKFTDAFNSFSVQTKARQAKQLAEAYRIDGVPTLGINGRYYTSPSLAGSPEKALSVADYLIQRSRKPG